MNAADTLVSELELSGVVLDLRDNKIIIDGPLDVVTDALIGRVRTLKIDIVALLSAKQRGWSAIDWQVYFGERAGIGEYDGGYARTVAEALAFEDCIDHWLAMNAPTAGEPNDCIICGETVCLPDSGQCTYRLDVLAASGKAGQVHASCWIDWQQEQRKLARAFLIETLHQHRGAR